MPYRRSGLLLTELQFTVLLVLLDDDTVSSSGPTAVRDPTGDEPHRDVGMRARLSLVPATKCAPPL